MVIIVNHFESNELIIVYELPFPGGMEETKLVKTMLSDLDPLLWRVYNYYDLNRPYSPSLFVAYRL